MLPPIFESVFLVTCYELVVPCKIVYIVVFFSIFVLSLYYYLLAFYFVQVTKANSLQHLNVGGTFITDESLYAVANSCPQIKVL